MISAIRDEYGDVLVLEAGNFLSHSDKQSEVNAEVTFMAMKRTVYDAVNIGPEDLSFGLQYLRDKTIEYGLPLVSTNLRMTDTGNGWVKKHLILEKNGFKVAVLGVMPVPNGEMPNPPATTSDYTIIPAEKVLLEILPEIRNSADFVVLLSHLDIAATKVLAERVTGIDLCITYGEGKPSHNDCNEAGLLKTSLENLPYVISADSKGESLGRLAFMRDASGEFTLNDVEIMQLDDFVPHDPEIDKLVIEVPKELKQRAWKEQQEKNLKMLELSPREFIEMLKNSGIPDNMERQGER